MPISGGMDTFTGVPSHSGILYNSESEQSITTHRESHKMLSKRSQTPNNTHCGTPFIENLKNKKDLTYTISDSGYPGSRMAEREIEDVGVLAIFLKIWVPAT